MTAHGGDAAISRVDAFVVEEGYAQRRGSSIKRRGNRAIVDAMSHPDAEPSVL
jgi:hypothetical protein